MYAKFKILDFQNKSFINSKGQKVEYNQLLVRFENGSIAKMKTNKEFDFEPYVDKMVNAILDVTVDGNLNASMRVMGVEE